MNKKLLAVAVAGVMMAPAAMADVTTYGRIVNYLSSADDGTDSELRVNQNTSRIGFKGAEDLGGGLQMIYTVELGADTDGDGDVYSGLGSTRQSYVGLKGDFGAVKIGNIWSPYYLMVNSTAQVLDGTGDDTVANGGKGGGIALSSRQANSITYDGAAGPAKFTVMLGAFNTSSKAAPTSDLDSDGEFNDSFNVIQAAASFPAGPVSVGVGYASVDNGIDDGTTIGVSGAYTMDNIKVAAEFHSVDAFIAGTADDDTQIALSGQFTAGMNRFVAVYENSAEQQGGEGETLIGLGFHHLFSKNTRAFVEYTSYSESEASFFDVGIFTNF